MKIVVTGSMPFSAEQVRRLQRVGRLTTAGDAGSGEEWLNQVDGADVVCSDGRFVAGNLERLHDVFVTFPFVEIGSFDTDALARRNVMVANARGSNRDSVVEWAVFVRYPSRGDDRSTAVKGCKLIVNSLSSTPSSAQLLDRAFFRALEPGSYFITYVRPHTFDVDALLESLDDGVLAGAAIDCDPQAPFDTANAYYRRLAVHSKVLATPHVAFATKQAERQSLEEVVENVEAFAKGRPRNVLVKR